MREAASGLVLAKQNRSQAAMKEQASDGYKFFLMGRELFDEIHSFSSKGMLKNISNKKNCVGREKNLTRRGNL